MISREQLESGDYDRVDVSELLEAYLRLKKLLKQEFVPEDDLPRHFHDPEEMDMVYGLKPYPGRGKY